MYFFFNVDGNEYKLSDGNQHCSLRTMRTDQHAYLPYLGDQLGDFSNFSPGDPMKKYACSECGRGFKELGRYRDHLLSHRKIKSHPCPFCSKLFTFKTAVQRHIRGGACARLKKNSVDGVQQ